MQTVLYVYDYVNYLSKKKKNINLLIEMKRINYKFFFYFFWSFFF